MSDIKFDQDGKARFPTKYHGEVILSQDKWETICSQPERLYYRYNGDKISTTLVNPDSVRHHRHNEGQFFYYKEFGTLKLREEVEVPCPPWCKYFAVVIDERTKRVRTVFPVRKPKEGKPYISREGN